jgi:hypothetical protein
MNGIIGRKMKSLQENFWQHPLEASLDHLWATPFHLFLPTGKGWLENSAEEKNNN